MPAVKPTSPQLRESHPLSVGLACGLPLHEGGGSTLHDLSGNGNTAALQTGVTWIGGQGGHTLNFNGAGYCILTKTNIPTRAPVTVACWAKFDTVDGRLVAYWQDLGLKQGWLLAVAINQLYWFCLQDSGNDIYEAITGAVLSTGTWFHLAGTMDADENIICYVNGKPTVGVFSSTNGTVGTNLWIGAESDNAGGAVTFLEGQMDNVVIYNRALGQSEIAALMFDSWQMYRPSRFFAMDRSIVADGITHHVTFSPSSTTAPHIQNVVTFTSTVADAEPHGAITTSVIFTSRVNAPGGDLASGRYRR